MQAVLMAGGKGGRMGELTRNIPKPLLPVLEKSLIKHILERLPEAVDHVIIVVGYLGEQIQSEMGDHYGQIKLTYAHHTDKLGTGAAVWEARPQLEHGKPFLIINGDDITSREDLEHLIQFPHALGIYNTRPEHGKYWALEFDANNRLVGHHYPSEDEMRDGIWVATGAYVTDDRIFEQELVKISNGEYGLPQTFFKIMQDVPITGVEFKNWIQVTAPGDLAKAEKILGQVLAHKNPFENIAL